MAFETLEVRMGSRKSRTPVTVALYVRENKVQVEFAIQPEVWKRLGWEPSVTRLEVLEGTGADEGHVQLLPSKRGTALSKRADRKDEPPVAIIRINAAYFKHTKFKSASVPSSAAEFMPFGSSLTVMILDIVED